jgi:hypothetical protein
MNNCYELQIVSATTRNEKGQITESNRFSGMLISDEAEEVFDKLLEKYDQDSFSLIWKLETTFKRTGNLPWAIAFYKEELRLAGHVVSIRNNREDVSLSSYTMPTGHTVEEYGVPSVSMLLFNSKSVLEELATKSELFNKAWEELSECSEDQNWICIAESPSEEWIKKTSEGDDQLFLKTLGLN